MFVKIIYGHFVFNQEKYQVCKFRIYRHFVKSVNGSNFLVTLRGQVIRPSKFYAIFHAEFGVYSSYPPFGKVLSS